MTILFSNKKGIDLLKELGTPYKKGLNLFKQIPEFRSKHADFDLSTVEDDFIVEDWYHNKTLYLQFYFKITEIEGVNLPVLFIIDKTKSRKNKEKAEKALEKYTELLSVLGHDFISPFNSMIGFLDLSIREKKLDYLPIVLKSANSILEQALQLLSLVKKDSNSILQIDKEEVDLNILVEQAISLNSTVALSQKIRVSNGIISKEKLYVNKTILLSIISNLVNNAIKFSYKGGRVNIISITNKDSIDILIIDNGVGMTVEEKKLLFSMEKFSKIGNNDQIGNGIGMINTQSLVHQLGGTIEMSSEKAKGSVFTVTLPLK